MGGRLLLGAAMGVAGTRERRLATAAVLLGMVISAFEGTVVTTAMPTITAALGGRALFAWVFTSFLLASTIGVMLAGKFGDHFGRRPTYLAGMAAFLGGTALCGAAPSMGWLIGFRALQGLGAGALQPTTMTITADIYTLEERAKMQSVITAVWGVANVLGPVIGGWIVGHASWRWVFLVNIPVGLLSSLLLVVSYRDEKRRGERLDVLGPVMAGVALALLLIALEPSAGALIRSLSGVTGLALGALFLQGQRHTKTPLIPFAHLGDRTVQTGLLGGALAGALLYGTATYLPLWVTQRGSSPLVAGFALVPMLAAWAVGSSFGVKVLIHGGMRASTAGGFLIAALGASLLALGVHFHVSLGWDMASLAVLGVGLGPAASTAVLGPQTVVPWHTRSVVTSAVYSTRMVGGAVTIALLDVLGREPAARLMWIAPFAIFGALAILKFAPAVKLQDADLRELSTAE